MPTLGAMTLAEAAEEAAGNWQEFNCFVWFRAKELEEPDDWALIYTHHRDSGLLDESNAAQIRKALLPYSDTDDADVVFESHSHWACGWVRGFSLRVFDKVGEVTKAFKVYHQLAEQIEQYPVLDECDYSEREHEATVENIVNAAWRLKDDFELPDDFQFEVENWLSDNIPTAIESCDDQGGWPDEDELREAFAALGYQERTPV